MEACRDELTMTLGDIVEDEVILAEDHGRLTGVAQVSFGEDGCFLEKMFVDPRDIGRGVGRKLFEWCVSAARHLGAREMIVESDPQAVDFYRRMGCQPAGLALSSSIPGRSLPRLTMEIDKARAS